MSLWLKIAIIWPFFVIFKPFWPLFWLFNRTTFMVTLGIGRTQTLVTHVGRWCGAIFALSGYLYGAGVVQNMAIFWAELRNVTDMAD